MKRLFYSALVLIGFAAIPAAASADVVLFAESNETAAVGVETPIYLKARLTESINALKTTLMINPDSVEFVRFDDADSVVRLWLQRGVVTDDGVVLEGVIPGGVGPAFTDVVDLGTVWVRPAAVGLLRIAFSDAEVYLNQPNATLSEVSVREFTMPIAESDGVPTDTAYSPAVLDSDVRIVRDENFYDGARTIVFDIKTDRGTVDRVQIRERWLGVWGSWRDTVSPSTLSDKWGVSILDVALSEAEGGVRVTSVVPAQLKALWSIVILLGLGLTIRRYKQRN